MPNRSHRELRDSSSTRWYRGHGTTRVAPLGRAHLVAIAVSCSSRERIDQSGFDIPLSEAAHADLYRFIALQLTEDKNEGHRAWRERRTPVFKGR
jgi:hypothetical protein